MSNNAYAIPLYILRLFTHSSPSTKPSALASGFGLWYSLEYMVALLTTALPYIQAILSVLLVVAILLQQTGSGMGALGGGSGDDSVHYTRRGAEKTLFQATIVLAILFVITALVALVI